MDTTEVESDDAYNSAVAAVLRARKAERNITNIALEKATGINKRTLIRLLQGERPIRMGQFMQLVQALDLDPSDVVAAARESVANTAR